MAGRSSNVVGLYALALHAPCFFFCASPCLLFSATWGGYECLITAWFSSSRIRHVLGYLCIWTTPWAGLTSWQANVARAQSPNGTAFTRFVFQVPQVELTRAQQCVRPTTHDPDLSFHCALSSLTPLPPTRACVDPVIATTTTTDEQQRQLRRVKSTVYLTGKPSEKTKRRMVDLLAPSKGDVVATTTGTGALGPTSRSSSYRSDLNALEDGGGGGLTAVASQASIEGYRGVLKDDDDDGGNESSGQTERATEDGGGDDDLEGSILGDSVWGGASSIRGGGGGSLLGGGGVSLLGAAADSALGAPSVRRSTTDRYTCPSSKYSWTVRSISVERERDRQK